MISQSDLSFINLFSENPALQIGFLLVAAWSLVWKGFALWKSAKNGQRNWFIALLILNTFGILEIIYIFYFSKIKNKKFDEKL